MDLYVLEVTYTNTSNTWAPVAVIDSYKSLIWTKRYYTCGDFELYIPANTELLNYLKPNNFIIRDDDDSVMIIEKVQLITDVEEGNSFIVSGRSLESILSRRVIVPQTNVKTSDPVQGIKQIVTEAAMLDNYRKIPGLVFDDSLSISGDMNTQYTGDNLLDTVTAICERFNFGFKMVLSETEIILSFYQGHEVNVIFSPEFDNLISSEYVTDRTNQATYAIVAGEGEGIYRRYAQSYNRSYWGLLLREIFVDARDLSSNNGEISDSEYTEKLRERGKEKLAEHMQVEQFDVEIEPSTTYKYKTDYNLGDIVTVTNEYGITAKPRIIEIIESWDETGYTVIPTLEELEV